MARRTATASGDETEGEDDTEMLDIGGRNAD